jgi:tetratricopeptide (TPR) repeat protein
LVALHLQQPEEAIGYLEKSSAEFAALQKINPSRRTYQHDIGRVLMFLGQAKYQQQNFPGALENYAKAVTLFEDIARADPGNNLPFEKLADAYRYMGDAHRDFAKILAEPEKEAHAKEATANYRRAFQAFSRLEAQHALTEYDRKEMEQLRATIAQAERE